MRETHVGVVFLVGDRAYKVKKPVDVGFLDFRTPESRHAACVREVELNRRLAPDVYLGIAEVSGVAGAAVEHVVVMRRMPDERRMSTLVHRGELEPAIVDQLARMIAAFHAGARRSPRIDREGTAAAIGARWTASFREVEPFHGSVVDADQAAQIERLTLAYLAGRGPLFDSRVADGRVVDGHGDLLADDIYCLPDGPRVLDCLEFDDRLRYVDGLDDIAFLGMDLERLGAPELARSLFDRYAEFAGDSAPASLRHHYIAYRAFVRAKVACVRQRQGDESVAPWIRRYLDLTLDHLCAGEIRLWLVGGLPGVGKSTLAGSLADELGAVLLSSDRIRKELAGLVPRDSAAAGYRTGLYTPDSTERTYRELLRRAEAVLVRGDSVVLDASWTSAAYRGAAAEIAHRTHSALIPVHCHAPARVAAARLSARRGDVSDADELVAAAMAVDADPWPDAYRVSTDGTVPDALRQVLANVLAR